MRTVLESYITQLMNEHTCWFTGNQNVVNILLHSSRKSMLQAEDLNYHNLIIESD